MAFECLLVSRDAGIVSVLNRLLNNLSIVTSMCLSSDRAIEQIAGGATDLVIIDWEDDSSGFLHGVREACGWRKPTIVAASDQSGLIRGADVTLLKPVTLEDATRSLKTAYFLMLFHHRRHARRSVMIAVKITNQHGRSGEVMITDIGDGGVGLKSEQEFAVGDLLSFRLRLPGTDRAVFIQARVRWVREYGTIGCDFLRIPPLDIVVVHDWLNCKNQVKKPMVQV